MVLTNFTPKKFKRTGCGMGLEEMVESTVGIRNCSPSFVISHGQHRVTRVILQGHRAEEWRSFWQ